MLSILPLLNEVLPVNSEGSGIFRIGLVDFPQKWTREPGSFGASGLPSLAEHILDPNVLRRRIYIFIITDEVGLSKDIFKRCKC